METYSAKIGKHPINDELKRLLEQIEDDQEVCEEHYDSFGRISQIVNGFSTSFKNCPKNLVSLSWLDRSLTAIQKIINNIIQYQDNKDKTLITTQISNELDVLLNCTVNFNCIRNYQSLKGAEKAFSEYCKTMDSCIENMIAKKENYIDEINDDFNQLQEKGDELGAELNELQQQIEKEKSDLDNKIHSQQQQIDEIKEETSRVLANMQDEYEQSKTNRQHDLTEQDKKFQNRCVDLFNQYRASFEEYENQVKDIIGIVNTNMFSHKYKEVADNAKKRSFVWHVIAMILLVCVVCFAIYAFVITSNKSMNWEKLVAKIFATSTMATGSAYAARQASKQEKMERYARKIEMELVAIDPFIEKLDNETKNRIKENVAENIFNNSEISELKEKDI